MAETIVAAVEDKTPSAKEYRQSASNRQALDPHPKEQVQRPSMFPAIYEIRLKTGKKLYGEISRIEYEKEEFYLINRKQVGMKGKEGDGQRIRFDDCQAVYAPGAQPGIFDSEDQIVAWRRFQRNTKQ